VASVELKGLSKHYGNTVAVDGVSLRVEHGQLVCLLGPSGCGKTTTLRLIAGFIEPSAGEIVVGGKVLSSPARTVPPEGRNMSMIFQSYALWPHMTVAENVAYGLKIRKLDKAVIDSKLQAILSTARLEALAGRYPGELSGGQQQRVAVARALVVEPEILLLDEPLSNLDANLREEMRFEIRRLHELFGITTLYVTHDQAEAMVISDRVAVLQHGRVVQIGAAQELFDRPRTRFVAEFIGRTNLIDGVAKTANSVARGALRLRVAAGTLTPGEAVAISLRPHQIELRPATTLPVGGEGENVLRGTVLRASYLGDAVDYQVQLAEGDTILRVAGPPPLRARPGESVSLRIPAAACIPLPAEGTT
jgi:iron(III) transport system ATP-binding protein